MIATLCAAGSTRDCNTSHGGDSWGVLSGYSATAEYNLATVLGSVDANTLVNAWATGDTATEPSAITPTFNSGNAVNITRVQPVSFSINVAGVPTGAVRRSQRSEPGQRLAPTGACISPSS